MYIQESAYNVNNIYSLPTIVEPNIYELFFQPGEVVELRSFGLFGKNKLWNNDYCKSTVVGYFNDGKKLQQIALSLDKLNPSGVYFTLNPVPSELIARAKNRLKANISATTDSDIQVVRWLPIDLDPKRFKGISSSDKELSNALELQEEIVEWLKEEFDIEPGILAMSGNGAHILVRIEDTDPEIASPIIKQALQAIAQKFPSEATGVDVDCSVFNPARIWKFYGTTARKGDDTSERPHRRAVIFDTGIKSLDGVPINEFEKIKILAGSYIEPKDKKNYPVNNSLPNDRNGANVDLDRFLNDYQNKIDVLDVKDLGGDIKMYRLEECLFADEHGTKTSKGDSGFIIFPNGKVIYQCFHNHCQKRTIYDALKKIAGDNYKKYVFRKNKTKISGGGSGRGGGLKKRIIFDREEKAIYKEVVTRDGEVVLEKIENYVLWPKAIMRNIYTHEPEGYKIEILTQNSNLEREVHLDKITVSKLEGLSLPPDNLRLVTSELIRKFQDEEDIPIEMLANKIGWLDKETFVHPITIQNVEWRFTKNENLAKKKVVYNPNIDERTAINNIKKIFKVMIDSKFPIFAIVPFALQTLHNPDNRIFFEITGNTSTGKSVGAKVTMMLLGWDAMTWDNTYNYLLGYLSSFDNYPVLLDEAHKVRKAEDMINIIYSLTQGEDRGRLNRDGSAKEKKTFNTAIISTGEKSVIDILEHINDVTPYGALARTLNITIDDIIFDQPTCVKLITIAKETGGWLLKLWLREHNRDSYKDVFESENFLLSPEDYQFHALNVFPAMFRVLKDLEEMGLLDKEYFVKAEIQLNEYLQQVKNVFKSEIEITNEDAVKEKFEEYIIQHLDKFENLYGDENFRGERWGWKDGDEIYILGNPLKKMLKESGLPQRLRKDFQRPEWLEKKSKRIPAINNTRKVYVLTLESIKE